MNFLEAIQGYKNHKDWVEFGRLTSFCLAFHAISPQRRAIVQKRLYNEFIEKQS